MARTTKVARCAVVAAAAAAAVAITASPAVADHYWPISQIYGKGGALNPVEAEVRPAAFMVPFAHYLRWGPAYDTHYYFKGPWGGVPEWRENFRCMFFVREITEIRGDDPVVPDANAKFRCRAQHAYDNGQGKRVCCELQWVTFYVGGKVQCVGIYDCPTGTSARRSANASRRRGPPPQRPPPNMANSAQEPGFIEIRCDSCDPATSITKDAQRDRVATNIEPARIWKSNQPH